MKKRKLPSYFQRIIVDFHEYMAEKPSQDELMVGLPEPIRLRLSLLLNRDLVKDIPILKQLPIGPIIGLMQKLSSEIYLPGGECARPPQPSERASERSEAKRCQRSERPERG